MEENGKGVLYSALTQAEWTQIPDEITKKLETYVSDKIDELLTSKALSETSKYNAETNSKELQEKLNSTETILNELQFKYDAATRTITELEEQITTFTSDMNKLQTACNRLEAETADFRHQRNLAVGERDEFAKALERRNAEVDRLNQEMVSMKELLQNAVNAKCVALADSQETSAMKLTYEYKEKRFEHERATLIAQVESLTANLNDRVDELLNLKKDNSLRCVQLENKLIEKTEELAIANESMKHLSNNNNNLTKKIEELTELLKTERDKDAKTYDLYQQEVDAQSKLADLYKNMSDKSNQQVEELAKAVSELQNLLHEATEKYGDLETKHKELQLSFDEIIQKKNDCIDMLKQELDSNNESLKVLQDESMLKEMESISPAAATASKLLKPDMSLNQMVSHNATLNMELIRTKEDYHRLESYLQQIITELEQKGPLLKKQREDYEALLETNKDVIYQNENLVLENQQLKEEALHCKKNEGIVSRENERLKKEISDLSRQVCHLLREIEQRSGSSSTSDHDMSDSVSSGDIITKRLVTFSDIVELQSTNRRLLSIVRELSAKQEEAESLDPSSIAQMRMKLETLQETQQSLLEQQENQNKMMSMVIGQRDMYKTLYDQAIKGTAEDMPMQMERPYIPDGERALSISKGQDDADSDAEKGHLHDLETQLEKAKTEIKTLREENDTYRKEKSANEKILLEQLEDLRKEVRELTKQNCKITSNAEMNEERFKIIQSNVEVYKNQLSALEKQNKIYSDSIIKHETMSTYLKNETFEATTKLSKAEVRLANLEKENALLNDRESRLLKELEFLKKESHAKNVLQNNIELIKVTLEKNDAERQIRLEERLDEAHRECSALRRRLQEEQDRFRELTVHLEKQSQTVQSQMEDEKNVADRLRKEVAEVREELILKQNQIEELTKKIKTSFSSALDDSVEGNKLRELEKNLIDCQTEIDSLQQQLKIANNTVQQHCNIAEGAEKQMKVMLDEQESYRKLTETKLREKEALIMKLEEQCSELQGELSIQNEGPDAVNLDLRGSLSRLQEELANTKTDLEETHKKLDVASAEIKTLTENLEAAENKYTREMMLHSTDLQALSSIKEELQTALKEIDELKHARDNAVTALEESKQGFAAQEEFFKNEKEQLQKRFKDMDAQNAVLLDQIQTLNSQLAIIHTQTSDLNISGGGGDANLSKSFSEEDVKSSDQLLKIIKYLRQEKDISFSKCEIFEAEHLRLKSQYETVCKQLEDAKLALERERQNSEASMIASAKQSEVLRKVETLNAITDSNRALRQERDTLSTQINQLKDRVAVLEDQVAPLQEKNKELSYKIDSMQSENVTLRGEATRWRQRANILIEKTNRTSPEDWKKLQNERENLAKQLTVERGNVAKLNDELNTLKNDKSKVDEQLRAFKIQHSQLSEDYNKVRDELKNVEEQLASITQELEQTRANYTKLIDEKNKLEDINNNKTETIAELKGNLVTIKKIAKKYKQQWEDLSAEANTLKQEVEDRKKNEAVATEKQEQLHTLARSELEDRIAQLEQTHSLKVDELTQQVSSATEESDYYKKEMESLKQSSFDKEERFKSIFKNAKERIMNLTEQNTNLRAELEGRSSSESTLDKSAEVERLLQEKEELLAEKQADKDKYLNEIETLNQRITQLQRQLGQQTNKPTTSSGNLEKSSTETPTANIKPMAGHSTNTQTQSVQIPPWRSGPETPLASIRPMSMQIRTIAVLPTSQGASTTQGPSAAVVTPQQVHTTGPSTTIEPLSNSPTSSHTEYMPATSSATPASVGPRQVAVPPTQSTQDAEDDDNSVQAQPTLQQQAVAMVSPRVEQPNNGPAQESGTSSSSSNTVTTTQASLKRQRDVDNDGCVSEEQQKSQQQSKRTRVQQVSTDTLPSQGTVTDSGLEVEYQVPTSSQRDHEEDNDAVIVVESDEDGDGPDEGEGVDDDPDTEGYDMEAYPEQELNYEDPDCQEMEEEEVSNEVEIVDDSSEVPNQSERSLEENISQEDNSEQAQSEAISSGTDGTSGVTVSQASTSVAPTFSRTRPIAPLSRQQQSHLLLPQGIEEGGDDGIVPSTPTLFVPRRSDGFSEAVSSPHVPTSGGRFTFSESTPPNNSGSVEVVPEQTLEFSTPDDNGTGRSVPGTPLQSSPQEAGPSGDDQTTHQSTSEDIPSITVSGVADEADAIPDESMGPPSTVGTAADASQPSDAQNVEMPESEDGVTSEGEKPVVSEDSEDEGREAEASPSTNTRSRSNGSRGNGSVARRSVRSSHMRGGLSRPGPTPIVWNEVNQHRQQQHRGRLQQANYASRVARRSRGRSPRSPYGGRY